MPLRLAIPALTVREGEECSHFMLKLSKLTNISSCESPKAVTINYTMPSLFHLSLSLSLVTRNDQLFFSSSS